LVTILKIAGVLLIAPVVAAVAFVLNLDPNDHKDRIAEMVKKETGRDVVFGGPMELDIGMTTRLVVRDVSFSNADWGSRPQLATVGLMKVEARLLPLLGGNLDIERVMLRDVDVQVETNAQGRSNLDFGSDENERYEDGDDGTSLGIGIGQLRIENVKVTYVDGVEGRTLVAKLERAIAVPASPGAPLDIDVKGKVTLDRHEANIALDGQVGSSGAILSGGEPSPINLKGELLGYDVTVEGGLRQPQNPDGFDIQILVVGDSLATIQPFIGKSLPKVGPVTLKAHVTGTSDHPVIENILVTAAKTRITGKAMIDASDGNVDYDLVMNLEGQDLGLISPYVGMPLGQIAPLNGKINIVGNRDRLRLQSNAVTVDRSRLTGSVTADLRRDPPQVEYDLTLTADGQMLDILEPIFGAELPDLGPINGSVRAVGDQRSARVEITDVSADKSKLAGRITLKNLDASPLVQYDINIKADAQPLEILRPYVGVDIADLGKVEGAIKAIGSLDKAKVTLESVRIDNTKFTGSADIDLTSDDVRAVYDVSIVAVHQSLGLFTVLAGANLSVHGPGDFQVSLKGDEKQASFEGLSLKFEDFELTGNGHVDLTGDLPDVQAVLNAPKFDLTRFFPDTTEVHKPQRMFRDEAARGAQTASSEKVFPTDPLPFDMLSSAKADISLKSGELITPYGTYRNVDVRFVMGDNVLDVSPFTAEYAGGQLSGSVSIDARAGTPLVSASLSSPSVAVGQVLQDFSNLDVLQGNGALNVALSGSGNSVADIMGSATGHARFLMGEGRMRNEGLGYVSGVFSSIGEVIGKKEWVVVDCLANDFELINGVANSKVGVLNTEVVLLTIGGKIDLTQERFDLKIKPLPRGLDISLAVPVNITGPLADPGFSPDAISSLAKLGSIFGAIVFPPAALIGLIELGGDDHPCVQYAKQSGENPDATPSAPLEKSSDSGVLGAPGKLLNGILGK
jgi:uncharacterized protein involved in outer membrane biogenesis